MYLFLHSETARDSRRFGRCIVHHHIDRVQCRPYAHRCVSVRACMNLVHFSYTLLIILFVLIQITYDFCQNIIKSIKSVLERKFEFSRKYCLSLSSVCTRKLSLCALFYRFFLRRVGAFDCIESCVSVRPVHRECISVRSSYKKMVQ